jgi:hypothetical protein
MFVDQQFLQYFYNISFSIHAYYGETFGTGISDLIKTPSYTIGSDMYINLID